MMNAPRLVIDLDKIRHNASTLVERLGRKGITVTGMTKVTLGSPEIARALLGSGIQRLGDSRIENIEALRRAHVTAPLTLVRSPMLSQVRRVVAAASVSFNTEPDVIAALSSAAGLAGLVHDVVLMVELGDLREGIMPNDLHAVVRLVLALPNIRLAGIGANLACRNGVIPDQYNMAELSSLADSIEQTFKDALGGPLDRVSGGNSANLSWALGDTDSLRINDLRLGESLLLGLDPLQRRPIDALHTDAFQLVAEVIESKEKPTRPWGDMAQNAFGEVHNRVDRGRAEQAILGIGQQDVVSDDLHAPPGIEVRGASSDHLIVESRHHRLKVGAEITFGLGYGALLRAMTSPYVCKVTRGVSTATTAPDTSYRTDTRTSHPKSMIVGHEYAI